MSERDAIRATVPENRRKLADDSMAWPSPGRYRDRYLPAKCKTCGAEPGQPCVTAAGTPVDGKVHLGRGLI